VTSPEYFGGIEAGGSKFICVVGRGPGEVAGQAQIDTAAPDATLSRVIEFFRPYCDAGALHSIGIGSFGPIDQRRDSPTYGFITTTPKPGWQDTDLVGRIHAALPVSIAFETDVNAAALGEYTWGTSRGLDSALYVTIGTGIGGGFLKDGSPLHGLQHPEMGHIKIGHDLERDHFAGSCPFHGDCFEGLASGPAIEKRSGMRGEHLSDDDPFWDIEADYIASALVTYILVLSPKIIILGGGIMRRRFLLQNVRDRVLHSLGGYVRNALLIDHISSYIVPPALGGLSGVFGAIALAMRLPDAHRDGGGLQT
jgi:fructokinase